MCARQFAEAGIALRNSHKTERVGELAVSIWKKRVWREKESHTKGLKWNMSHGLRPSTDPVWHGMNCKRSEGRVIVL